MEATKHVFELAGLGKAPFRFVGMETQTYQACPDAPVWPGGSCDYCSTAIREFCWIVDVNGKRFHVGSTCVLKTNDSGLINPVKRELARHRREAKAVRDNARIQTARDTLDSVRPTLRTQTHPQAWAAKEGLTLEDWAEWMLANAGTKGRLEVARVIEKATN